MGDSVGLIVSLGADSGEFQAAIKDLQDSLGKLSKSLRPAAQEAAAATKPLDDALLNQHQSVHLLAEEMGVHLPRAVVGAVAEMIPKIQDFGGALLGAFAVREIIHFSEELYKIGQEFDGVAEAQKQMGEYVDENTRLMERQARASTTVARNLLHQAQAAAAAAAATVNNFQNQKDELEAYFGAAAPLISKLTGLTGNYNEAQKESIRLQKQAAQFADIFTEDAEKNKEKEARAVEQATEREQRAFEQWQRSAESLPIFGPRNPAAIGVQAWAVGQEQLNKELERSREALRFLTNEFTSLFNAESRQKQVWLTAASAIVTQTTETRHLTAARRALLEVTQQLTQVERAYVAVGHDANEEKRNQIQNMASEIETFVGAIAGRKAQAEVEGGFFLAEGAFDVARGIWPPNPQLIAKGLGEIGAGLDMLKVAGKSGGALTGSGGGGGAGGRYDHSGYGKGSDREQWYPPQTLAPGAASQGGRFGSPGSGVVIIRGTQEFENCVASAVNGAVSRGVTVNATTSQRGAPVGH